MLPELFIQEYIDFIYFLRMAKNQAIPCNLGLNYIATI